MRSCRVERRGREAVGEAGGGGGVWERAKRGMGVGVETHCSVQAVLQPRLVFERCV